VDFPIKTNDVKIRKMFLAHPNAKNFEIWGIYGLINALVIAIEAKNPEFIRVVLSHPNASKLLQDEWPLHLGNPLLQAVKANNPELVRTIISHPNTANIQAKYAYGLGGILQYAIEQDSEIVAILLSHPNAVNIPAEGQWSIKVALGLAQTLVKPEHEKLLLSFR
jgi:hypothetical protein